MKLERSKKAKRDEELCRDIEGLKQDPSSDIRLLENDCMKLMVQLSSVNDSCIKVPPTTRLFNSSEQPQYQFHSFRW